MYCAYFGLTENPFSLTPDPRFLFMSHRHREALAHLLYGMGEKGGFGLLTGEVGTGKTTLCRSLLEQVPDGVEAALVLNPKQTALELVASLCDELGVSYPPGSDSLKVFIDLLNLHLLETHSKGRRTVLIIDEAQNLSADVLEQIRLLTNLETTTQKLLQILLIGQPELQTMMAQPELRQLGQRITARYHLAPLLSDETAAYVQHRLEVAGCGRHLFTKGALRLIHRLSGGIPRLINTVCDRALLGAYAGQRNRVNRRLVRKAASEVMGKGPFMRPRRLIGWALAIVFLCLLGSVWKFGGWPDLLERAMVTVREPEKQPDAASIGRKDIRPQSEERNPEKRTGSAVESETVQFEEARRKTKTETGREEEEENRGSIMLSKLLEPGTTKTDIETAFATLFKLWRTAYPDLPGMTACERAAEAGLSCLYDRGNWTSLRHLNRPAILELIDRNQGRHYVVAAAMKNGDIILDFGDQQVTLALAEIEPFWFGEFTIVWKPPTLGSFLLKEGDSGPDVLWLRAQLDLVQGLETGAEDVSPSPFFDEGLKRRVKDFQSAYSVMADGMVGEQTLIQLNTAGEDTFIPQLSRQSH